MRHSASISQGDLAQRLIIVRCPVLNHLDQRTPVLGWCWTRRTPRTGRSLLETVSRKRQNTPPTPHAMEIDSYPTLKKLPSLSATILAVFLGTKLECAPSIKCWFAQTQHSKALLYLLTVSRYCHCYKNKSNILFVDFLQKHSSPLVIYVPWWFKKRTLEKNSDLMPMF